MFVQFIKSHLDDDAVSEIIQDGEKIAAAQTLRNSSSVLQGILDEAIGVVIRQRGVRVPPSLTKQDLFYSQVRSSYQFNHIPITSTFIHFQQFFRYQKLVKSFKFSLVESKSS